MTNNFQHVIQKKNKKEVFYMLLACVCVSKNCKTMNKRTITRTKEGIGPLKFLKKINEFFFELS